MDLKEILQKMQAEYDAAKKSSDIEEKAAHLDEFDRLNAEKESIERMEAAEKAMASRQMEQAIPEREESSYDKAVKDFANAARHSFKAMNEGTNEDGGYTVPEDISTRVEHLREAKFSLETLVPVIPVSTKSGERTFKKRSEQTGFASVDEGAKIPLKATPQFSRYSYNIVKYAGVFPVTNELLSDSDANIVAELTQWIADEGRVTRNKLVKAVLDEKYTRTADPETAIAIKSVDDIMTMVNVTLGQAFASTSKIITNDHGFNWICQLKDGDGNYLLKAENNDPQNRVLACGSLVIPVRVIPSEDLPVEDGKFPFYIGDLSEGVRLFDRKKLSIKASDVAFMGSTSDGGDNSLNAFQEDLTLFRAIERLDCVLRDEKSFYKGLVTPTAG